MSEEEAQEEVLAGVVTDLQDQVRDLTAERDQYRAGSRSFMVAATELGNVVETQKEEIDRLRAALTLVAIPPYGDGMQGCAGCAGVAQSALDGHDYRPNVAAIGLSEDHR